jgi:membrane-associated phospholipid phosphatase
LDNDSQKETLLPEEQITCFWSAHRRHILRASLVTGLVVFLLWLPAAPRAAFFQALIAHQALVGMLLLFTLVALSLVWSTGQRLDTWVFTFINLRGYHPAWLDRALWWVTQLGNVVTAILLAALFYGLNYHRLTVEIVIGTITLWLIVETIKVLADRARPFLALEGTRVIGGHERGRSFPSGHTSQTFFLMTLFIHQFQPGILGALALYTVAVLVGFTRIYVGVHYPRDVIGGAMLGSIWGVLMVLVDPYWFGLQF